MNCPKCKVSLPEKKKYDAPYLCEQCGGMWIHTEQMPDFSGFSDEIESNISSQENYDLRTGMCPSGHGIMVRTKVDMDDPFYLERCTTCGGVWFDKGEWQRIARTTLLENLENMWCKSWQKKQREKKNRDSFLEMNQKLLGDDLFQRIMALSEILKKHPDSARAIALLQQELNEK